MTYLPPQHLIVIGASAGGFNALKMVLGVLPNDFPVPILVVQHCSAAHAYKRSIPHLLAEYCQLKLHYAENGALPKAGHVYIAPPDYHLRVDISGLLMISHDQPVRFSRPSIDVLFESVSRLKTSHITAIILTGSNSDGTKGAKAIQQAGGKIIIQYPDEAEAPEMPKSVMTHIDVDHMLYLEQIGPFLWEHYRSL